MTRDVQLMMMYGDETERTIAFTHSKKREIKKKKGKKKKKTPLPLNDSTTNQHTSKYAYSHHSHLQRPVHGPWATPSEDAHTQKTNYPHPATSAEDGDNP
jgi:hypothetical protein